ncbi:MULTISPECIES: EhaF family protein [unclassified Methanobrevibacter]|jgi:energy-converting hydrogenase A subunit F|uniref:EhaF family protein n=1 Tax=unclassified Methanobrevibacter TaxID=2638681 RepID=UPI0025F0BC4C|nr:MULTISPECIES: EhaF family protein [unclassified Methanobrevibacter]MEE0941824.1 EhaF family protein [Methanobrevibacter sp.]
MKIGSLWNKLAEPKNIPRLFAFSLGIILIVGLIVPMALNPDQLYVRPAPQVQVDEGLAIAPYDRGGEVLKSPGNINPQYPENAAELGMITAYMSPLAQWISSISPYFGTSIYSSPGGLIDEVLYYTRGFDTILESSILMMSFIIASWLSINYTMNRKNDEKEIKADVKKAINESAQVANEVKVSDVKARSKQLRRDN